MDMEETRFSYVYRNIRRRIDDGLLKPGDRLPSARQLSDEFQIGIFTIKKAMAALKNEGLILIEPRRAPVVADQAPGSEEQYEEAVILSQKNMILSVWQTIALLMPSIFTFASQDCHIEALPHYKQAMRAGKGNITGAWRPLNLLCKEILDASDNPLFSHLFATFDLYTCLPYFTEKSTYFIDEFLRPADRVTFAIIEALKMESRVEKCQYIRRMYQALHDDIRLSIDNLERKFSKSPPPTYTGLFHTHSSYGNQTADVITSIFVLFRI